MVNNSLLLECQNMKQSNSKENHSIKVMTAECILPDIASIE